MLLEDHFGFRGRSTFEFTSDFDFHFIRIGRGHMDRTAVHFQNELSTWFNSETPGDDILISLRDHRADSNKGASQPSYIIRLHNSLSIVFQVNTRVMMASDGGCRSQSSLFSPTQTRKKCRTAPDARRH